MVDALGILSFSLHAAHKIYTVFQSIKDAPNDIQALRDDAFHVHELLRNILPPEDNGGQSRPSHASDLRNPQIDALVEKAQDITATADKFISKTTIQRDDGTYVVKKLRWPLYASDAKALSARFKAFYHSLTAAYVVLTFITMNAMSSDLQIVLQMMRTSATIYGAAREQREGRSMRFDEIYSTQANHPLVPFPRAEVYAGPYVPASQCPSQPNTHFTDPTENVGDSNSETCELRESDETSQAYDGVIVSPASVPETTNSSSAAASCPNECSCACHKPTLDISPIPSCLNPWLGRFNIPRTLAASLLPSLFPCNDLHCQRNRGKPQTVRYYLPLWCAQLEASIRFEAFPVHFCIQTPRMVPSLVYLYGLSFDHFRIMLSTGATTLQDVEPDGRSVLHRLLGREQDHGDAYDLIRYAIDAGIPQDWQYLNMTAVEYTAYSIQRYPQFRDGAQSLESTVVRPLLRDSLDEASCTLNEKLGQSDLVTFVSQPHQDVAQALVILRTMLALPVTSAQIRQSDVNGWSPIHYAACAFPEAVEVLLQAGSSTKHGAYLLHQRALDQWKAISALIRAGYTVDEWAPKNLGTCPLHSVTADRLPSYRHALELARHGSHLLNWDARDYGGRTLFTVANELASKQLENEQLQRIRELYFTQRIPYHAQYISSFDGERLMGEKEASAHPRISLIDSVLLGDVAAIEHLILRGAMVNERDEKGQTLLHLVAMGDRVPNAYRVALELVRHGGRRGVDWDAKSIYGRTALEIAVAVLERDDLAVCTRREVEQVRELLELRCLPAGESYVFPCMDPTFCCKCESLRCTCIENDVPGMPGSFVN